MSHFSYFLLRLLTHSACFSTGERHQTYLGAAIRIAQQLGLHQLGHDPNTMPADDPALPPGVNTTKREIPIRLFYTLLFLDYMGIRSKPGLPPNLGEGVPFRPCFKVS